MLKLTDQEKQEIVRFIEAGKELPEKYRFLLSSNRYPAWYLPTSPGMLPTQFSTDLPKEAVCWNNPTKDLFDLRINVPSYSYERIGVIFCEMPPPEGIGQAFRDRRQRAAKEKQIIIYDRKIPEPYTSPILESLWKQPTNAYN